MTRSKTEVQNRFSDILSGDMSGVPLEIAQDAVKRIIIRLTDLYNDPVVATVRETVSNALDATPAGGLPVEITVPNAFSPYFEVTDHGTGMSPETVRESFLRYGASIKADDLDAVGAFGLGAKAPLSYADSFDVFTVQDGVRTSLRIYKEDGVPKQNMTVEDAPDDSNGTTVRVPSNDHERFYKAVHLYRKFSMTNPIVIDGVLHDSNSAYIPVGDITIYRNEQTGEQETGRVWISRYHFSTIMDSIKHGRFLTGRYDDLGEYLTFVLSGFPYRQGSSGSGDTDVVVIEIKPGIVNFSSSRDEIKKDDKFLNLWNLVKEQLNGDTDIWSNFYHYAVVHDDGSEGEYFERGRFITAVDSCDQLVDLDNDTVIFKNFSKSAGRDFEHEIPVSRFDSENGTNIIRALTVGHDEPSVDISYYTRNLGEMTLLPTEVPDLTDETRNVIPVIPEVDKSTIFSRRGGEKLSVQFFLDNIQKRIHENNPVPMISALFNVLYLLESFDPVTILFVNYTDDKDINRVVRRRAAAESQFGSHVVMFVRDGHRPSNVEQKALTEVMKYIVPQKNISMKFMNVEEYIKALVKVPRGGHTADKQSKVFFQKIFPNGVTREDVVRNNTVLPRWEDAPLDEVLNIPGDPLYVAFDSSMFNVNRNGDHTLNSVLNGWLQIHGDDALRNRSVIGLYKWRKDDLLAVGMKPDRLILAPHYENHGPNRTEHKFSHASDEINKHVDALSTYRDTECDRVRYLTSDEQVWNFLRSIIPRHDSIIRIVNSIVERYQNAEVLKNFQNISYRFILDGKGHIDLFRTTVQADVSVEDLRHSLSDEDFDQVMSAAGVGRLLEKSLDTWYGYKFFPALNLLRSEETPFALAVECLQWLDTLAVTFRPDVRTDDDQGL